VQIWTRQTASKSSQRTDSLHTGFKSGISEAFKGIFLRAPMTAATSPATGEPFLALQPIFTQNFPPVKSTRPPASTSKGYRWRPLLPTAGLISEQNSPCHLIILNPCRLRAMRTGDSGLGADASSVLCPSGGHYRPFMRRPRALGRQPQEADVELRHTYEQASSATVTSFIKRSREGKISRPLSWRPARRWPRGRRQGQEAIHAVRRFGWASFWKE